MQQQQMPDGVGGRTAGLFIQLYVLDDQSWDSPYRPISNIHFVLYISRSSLQLGF